MICDCCICNSKVTTFFKLKFQDLPGGGNYTQSIGLCLNCGYIFTQNPFSQEQLDERYKNMSKFEYDSDDYILDNKFREQSIRQFHFLEENINFDKVNSLLEIGAASGYNLSLYVNKCDRILGIEPSQKNCYLGKKNYSVDMYCGMFENFYLNNKEKFDLIFLSMILEHIVDPAEFINKLKLICNKYVFIEVPILDIRHMDEPMGIFCEEHVSLFTLDSLNELMSRAGFKLINIESNYGFNNYLPAGYPSVATIWEKTDRINDFPLFRFNIFSSEELLNKYISWSFCALDEIKKIIDSIPDSLKIAVWGIGHHAAMLLANTSLSKKNIVKVYDSDVRKHHLSFAGVSISTFNENDIINGDVEAILLTTYTAQKAIKNYLVNLNTNVKLYTLYNV